MAGDVGAWCEKAQAFGRTVTVKVKFADFHQVTRSRTFAALVARRDPLRQAGLDLVRLLFPPAQAVRLVGVSVSNFPASGASAEAGLSPGRPSLRFLLRSCPLREPLYSSPGR